MGGQHLHHHHHADGPDGGDGPPTITAASVRRALTLAAGAVAALALVGLVVWWPTGEAFIAPGDLGFADRVDGTVTDAGIEACTFTPDDDCAVITVDVGEAEPAVLEHVVDDGPRVPAATLRPGDEVVLVDSGPDVPAEVRYSFADFQRGPPLVVLAIGFAAAVVVVGRFRGLLALAGLVVSVGVVLAFVLPALLRGHNPVGVALTGAAVIALAALYLSHGFSQRTTVALLGTVASLGLTAALAAAFSSAARLTGLAAEEAFSLFVFAPELDFRGLLLAAVIIGSLGVLDDVTVTQTSAVWELHRADADAGFARLYAAAIRIGRDHIASTTNTLVLAYTAAALPLLLVFTQSGMGWTEVLTTETVAVEIVQTLVGSIGLVASVPITTALAAWVVTRR